MKWTPQTVKAHHDILGLVVAIGILAIIFTLNTGNAKAIALALEGQREATKVALTASDAKGVAHNGLIERMREMSNTFVTRGNVLAAFGAAGVCATIWGVFGQ